jgi:hypothetical protein
MRRSLLPRSTNTGSGNYQKAVDHGGGDGLVAEDGSPAIWGWHMFGLVDLGWCLGLLGSGVFADL